MTVFFSLVRCTILFRSSAFVTTRTPDAGGDSEMAERWDEEEEQRGRRPLHFPRSRGSAEKAMGKKVSVLL